MTRITAILGYPVSFVVTLEFPKREEERKERRSKKKERKKREEEGHPFPYPHPSRSWTPFPSYTLFFLSLGLAKLSLYVTLLSIPRCLSVKNVPVKVVNSPLVLSASTSLWRRVHPRFCFSCFSPYFHSPGSRELRGRPSCKLDFVREWLDDTCYQQLYILFQGGEVPDNFCFSPGRLCCFARVRKVWGSILLIIHPLK